MKPTHELTRAGLILRLQDAEDLAAWDEFAAIYGPVVFNVAKSRGFQSADAENLVQEVFMAVASWDTSRELLQPLRASSVRGL